MDQDSEAPPSRPYQNFRSTASVNWRVKDDSPRAEPPQPSRQRGGGRGGGGGYRQSADDGGDDGSGQGSRLYVGNLLYTAQRADIEELFTANGFNVVNVSISTDPFTGRNPSYCFVDVDSPDEAQRAIAELNGMDVLGRGVKVSPGVARRSGQGAGADRGANGGRDARPRTERGGWGGSRDTREERNTEYKPSFDRWSRNDASSHWTAPQSEGRRLYVGGLPRMEPQSAVDEEIQTLFALHLADYPDIRPSAVSKLISPHPSKAGEPGNHHYCFVDLERAEDMEIVIEALAGKEGSWGGPLRVNRAKEQRDRGGPERKVVREQGLGGGERRGGGGGGWRREQGQE